MNSIDFTKYSKFPVSSESFQFMQEMLTLIAKLASLGGTNYILQGCTENGSVVDSGTVVVNGEILPFTGGTKSTYVIISETNTDVQVYDTLYEDVYTTRKVIFGTGTGQLTWSSFKSFTDLLTLASSLGTLSDSFSSHVNDHSVAWEKVSGKPSTYPSAAHDHAWDEITDKPLTSVYLGEFDEDGTTVTKLSGDLTVTVTKGVTGQYILTHNIGHTNYIVVGVGIGGAHTQSIREMDDIAENTCSVYVSDDETSNDSSVRFMIIITE